MKSKLHAEIQIRNEIRNVKIAKLIADHGALPIKDIAAHFLITKEKANKILSEMALQKRVVSIGRGYAARWTIPGTPQAKQLERERYLREKKNRDKNEKDRLRNKTQWMEARRLEQEEPPTFTHRVVDTWEASIPPTAVRSIFHMAEVL